MKYNVTIERTYRTAVTFEAANDKEAEAKANELADNIGDEIFEGTVESDWALCDAHGNLIVDWN